MLTFLIILLYIVLLGLGLVLALYYPLRLISTLISDYYGAPFVALECDVVDSMIALSELQPDQQVFDLGSGDGRILFRAVDKCAVRATGYEVSYYPLLLCWLHRLRYPRLSSAVQVERCDFFKRDLSTASAVFLYQLPAVLERLKPKLLAELKPGTRIVSARFAFHDWEAEKVDLEHKYPVYLYRLPIVVTHAH